MTERLSIHTHNNKAQFCESIFFVKERCSRVLFNVNKKSKNSIMGFPGGSVIKNLPANAGGSGSIPGPERCPPIPVFLGAFFPGDSEDKVSACNAGNPGSIPGSGRSHGEGNGHPLQYSWRLPG